MIDKYIILNRKTTIIIKLFIFNVLLLLIVAIWCINTCYYQSFFHIHSQIIRINSFYYLEVLIPVKEVKQIVKQNKVVIDSVEYIYQIYQIEPKIVYQDETNYQKIYLEIEGLRQEYQIDGYQLEIKIPNERKKIINYLKE